jgi:hypothetical protein
MSFQCDEILDAGITYALFRYPPPIIVPLRIKVEHGAPSHNSSSSQTQMSLRIATLPVQEEPQRSSVRCASHSKA